MFFSASKNTMIPESLVFGYNFTYSFLHTFLLLHVWHAQQKQKKNISHDTECLWVPQWLKSYSISLSMMLLFIFWKCSFSLVILLQIWLCWQHCFCCFQQWIGNNIKTLKPDIDNKKYIAVPKKANITRNKSDNKQVD